MHLPSPPLLPEAHPATGAVPDPGADDVAAQLALLPTVASLLQEFTQRATAQAQRQRQPNTLWRAAHSYWREWLAARIDRLRPHVPPDNYDSLLRLLRRGDVVGETRPVEHRLGSLPPFCGLPSAEIHSLCKAWLHGVEEREQAEMIGQLVDFVQHANRVDQELTPPQSPALLRTLLTDVCARVKSLVVDRSTTASSGR